MSCHRPFARDKRHYGNTPLSDTRTNFWNMLAAACAEQRLTSLVLSKRRKGAAEPLEKLRMRPVVVQGQSQYQLAAQANGRETHENVDADAVLDRLKGLFGPVFEHCHFSTDEFECSARVRRDGRLTFKRKRSGTPPRPIEHDRQKNYLIPDGVPCPFLHEIGVMTDSGRVRVGRYDKFRQVNRFLELVNDAISALPATGPVTVVDFGCGKSYLTFALHHLLTVVHNREVHVTGLDRNAEVVQKCSSVAEKLGCTGLEFHVGDIADFRPTGPVHLAVSLHACDTATDDALAQAVRWQTEVILAVPCCQHELAKKIHSEPLAAIERYGILHERFAALATDALRAAALEICGYKTQVVEFIDLEHTAKNVLIRAVRKTQSRDAAAAIERYRNLKQLLGVEDFALEQALEHALGAKLFRQAAD